MFGTVMWFGCVELVFGRHDWLCGMDLTTMVTWPCRGGRMLDLEALELPRSGRDQLFGLSRLT